jgi:hypothetical protein
VVQIHSPRPFFSTACLSLLGFVYTTVDDFVDGQILHILYLTPNLFQWARILVCFIGFSILQVGYGEWSAPPLSG